MEEYFDSDEWGQIVFEETTKNMEIRMGPKRRQGLFYIFVGIVDFLLAVVIFSLSQGDAILKDLSQNVIMILIFAFVLSGIVSFVIGAFKLGKKARKTVILEKGIVRGSFRHFENIPVIEVRGSKERVVVLRSSQSAPIHTDLKRAKGRMGYSFILEAPEEYDYVGYIEALKKLGFGGDGETRSDNGEKGDRPKKEGGAKAPDVDEEGPKD